MSTYNQVADTNSIALKTGVVVAKAARQAANGLAVAAKVAANHTKAAGTGFWAGLKQGWNAA